MWIYRNKEINDLPEGYIEMYVGFVYIMENLITKEKYIGQKRIIQKRKIKNKKTGKSKTTIKESDWRTYQSSCKTILDDIEENTDKHYKKTIILFCHNLNELNLIETMTQIKAQVLIRDEWLNKIINCRVTHRGLDGLPKDINIIIEKALANTIV